MKLVKDADQLQEKKHKISDEKAEEAIRTIIEWIGEDPEREGLLSTPKRVVKAFKEYFRGYNENPDVYLSKTFSEIEGYDDQANFLGNFDFKEYKNPVLVSSVDGVGTKLLIASLSNKHNTVYVKPNSFSKLYS